MALAVDQGIYRTVSSSAAFRYAWVSVMFAAAFGGVGAFLWITWWFVNGDPTQNPRFFMRGNRGVGHNDAAAT
jgi:hypothetical protein